MNDVKIDVKALKVEERLELAKLLLKCEYTVSVVKEKTGKANNLNYYVIGEKK